MKSCYFFRICRANFGKSCTYTCTWFADGFCVFLSAETHSASAAPDTAQALFLFCFNLTLNFAQTIKKDGRTRSILEYSLISDAIVIKYYVQYSYIIHAFSSVVNCFFAMKFL